MGTQDQTQAELQTELRDMAVNLGRDPSYYGNVRSAQDYMRQAAERIEADAREIERLRSSASEAVAISDEYRAKWLNAKATLERAEAEATEQRSVTFDLARERDELLAALREIREVITNPMRKGVMGRINQIVDEALEQKRRLGPNTRIADLEAELKAYEYVCDLGEPHKLHPPIPIHGTISCPRHKIYEADQLRATLERVEKLRDTMRAACTHHKGAWCNTPACRHARGIDRALKGESNDLVLHRPGGSRRHSRGGNLPGLCRLSD